MSFIAELWMFLRARKKFWLLLLFPLAVWCAIVLQLMIVDVWDETRGMQLVMGHPTLELIASNWMQNTVGGKVLFRPLPFLFFTLTAKMIDDPETLWRVLRISNVALLLASLALLVASVRRWREPDLARDGAFVLGLLFSGSAIITAVRWVFARGMTGTTEASTTQRLSTPMKRQRGSTTDELSSGEPILQEPQACT